MFDSPNVEADESVGEPADAEEYWMSLERSFSYETVVELRHRILNNLPENPR